MERSIPSISEERPGKLAALLQWAQENPAAFAGLWFAAVATLLATRLLTFLPGIVAQAYSIGGTEGWASGAMGVGYAYVAPGLLALVIGMPLGKPIVEGSEPHGWEAALRGALIGTACFSLWLLLAPLLARPILPESLWTAGYPVPGLWVRIGLAWLLLAHLVMAGIGGWAGFLLRVFCKKSPQPLADEVAGAGRVESRRDTQ